MQKVPMSLDCFGEIMCVCVCVRLTIWFKESTSDMCGIFQNVLFPVILK